MQDRKFDFIDIPPELDEAVQEGIRKGKKEMVRRRRGRALLAGTAAAAFVAVFAAYCGANPAFAEKLPVVGRIFEKVEKEGTVTGDWSARAVNLSEMEEQEEQAEQPQSEEEIAEQMYEKYGDTYENIKMTPMEVYCDGASLYVTVLLENTGENGFGKLSYGMDGDYQISQMESGLYMNGSEISSSSELQAVQADAHTVEGMVQFTLNQELPEDVSCEMEMKIDLLVWFDDSKTGDAQETSDHEQTRTCMVSGVWDLKIPVTVERDRVQTYTVNQTGENGFGLQTVEVTPYEVRVKLIEPSMTTEERAAFNEAYLAALAEKVGQEKADEFQSVALLKAEYDPNCVFAVFDQNGEPLSWARDAEGYDTYAVNGRDLTKLCLYLIPEFVTGVKMQDMEYAKQCAVFAYELELSEN